MQKGKENELWRIEAAKRSRIEHAAEQNDFIDVNGAAEMLGIRASTVRSWCSSSQIPAYRRFGRVMFSQAELKKFRALMTMPV